MTRARMPEETDLARLTDDPVALMTRLLSAIEVEIVLLTRAGAEISLP